MSATTVLGETGERKGLLSPGDIDEDANSDSSQCSSTHGDDPYNDLEYQLAYAAAWFQRGSGLRRQLCLMMGLLGALLFCLVLLSWGQHPSLFVNSPPIIDPDSIPFSFAPSSWPNQKPFVMPRTLAPRQYRATCSPSSTKESYGHVSLDGESGYLRSVLAVPLAYTDFTFSVWLWPSTVNNGTSKVVRNIVSHGSSSLSKFDLVLTPELLIYFTFSLDGHSLLLSSAPKPLQLGRWCHVVVSVQHMTLMSLYINGVLASSVPISYDSSSATSKEALDSPPFSSRLTPSKLSYAGRSALFLGANAGLRVNQEGKFAGQLDSVGLWRRLLTAEEIYLLFSSAFSPLLSSSADPSLSSSPAPGTASALTLTYLLTLWYSFDEQGSVVAANTAPSSSLPAILPSDGPSQRSASPADIDVFLMMNGSLSLAEQGLSEQLVQVTIANNPLLLVGNAHWSLEHPLCLEPPSMNG